ncbi:hypothetical protein diail_1649 [Diaporthe ilicicola]|nr:hypothetical protein diail_1649 [Diaporthe ilicicola]
MDATQSRGRLRAFLKHATIRISSTKDHGFLNDSASAHSIEDDAKTQTSCKSTKKNSKLRRIGRGIRQWRSKRRRLHGDTRPDSSHSLEGKSFTSSEGSLAEDPLDKDTIADNEYSLIDRPGTSHSLGGKSFTSSQGTLPEDIFEKDNVTNNKQTSIDRPEYDHLEVTNDVSLEETSEQVSSREGCEEDVIANKHTAIDRPQLEASNGVCLEQTSDEMSQRRAEEDATPSETQMEIPSGKEAIIPDANIPLPPLTVYSSFVWSDLVPQAKVLAPSGIVFRRDTERAFDFAQSTLDNKPAFWTDASHMPIPSKGRTLQHHGGIAVAQKLDQQWTVHSAYTSGVSCSGRLEFLAILMALQRAVQEKKAGILGKDTIYICSDSAQSLEWLEKAIALATTIRKVAQGTRALEADVDDLSCLIRLSDALRRWEVIRLGDYNCLENSLIASIGIRILEQYYELRRLGAWVEFHWVPAHSGLPGNEIADRVASLSRWLFAKVAPRHSQDVGVVMPLKVLTFDEPWYRYCPHKGQPQYNKRAALQNLEEIEDLRVVLSIEAPRPVSCDIAMDPVEAMAGTNGLALQPASQDNIRLLHHPSYQRSPESGDATMKRPALPTKAESPPNYGMAVEVCKRVVPTLPTPPPPPPPPPPPSPPLSKPHLKVQRQGRKKMRPARGFSCTHCGQNGHQARYCFDKYPEQKIVNQQRYAGCSASERLEKVTPGAFRNLVRLHPQMLAKPIHGEDSRYLLGRVGICPHLTPMPLTLWAVQLHASQPGHCATTGSVQDHRRQLRDKYRWDEAQREDPLD